MFEPESLAFLRDVDAVLLNSIGKAINSAVELDAAVDSLCSEQFDAVRAKATAEVTTESSLRFRKARSEGHAIYDWNDYVGQISDLHFDFRKSAEKAVHRSPIARRTDECIYVITAMVYQSFLSICTSTTQTSRFYSAAIPILKSGHLPCGWTGDYPIGEVITI